MSAGYDPADLLIQIPTMYGEQIEMEMSETESWRETCPGIALYADGHRKQIEIYGVRVYWKTEPPLEY